MISLAKREEEIYVPGRSEPIVLSRRSFALRLLQYVRDEAHRFAQHYHHMLRKKRTLGDEDVKQPWTSRSSELSAACRRRLAR